MPPRNHALATLTKRWLPVFICINLLLLLVYLTLTYQLTFHSDSAVKNLLAQEIVETGHYFPRDWNYANGDLWLLYTQTWIVPLLHFFPNGYALHAASDVVTAALTLAAVWLVGGLLGQSRLARLLAVLLISSGMSPIMAEHMFGQAAYGSMFYMAGFLLYSYWALHQAEGALRWLWGGAVAALIALVFWSNPQRGLMFYGLPLALAALTVQRLDRQAAADAGRPMPRRHVRQLGLCLLAMLAGVALHVWTMHRVNDYPGDTLVWLDAGSMARNALGAVSGVIGLFDGWPAAGGRVLSAAGVYQALRLAAAVFSAASLALNLFVLVGTSLTDMSEPATTVRYLVPTVMLLLVILTGVLVDRR